MCRSAVDQPKVNEKASGRSDISVLLLPPNAPIAKDPKSIADFS